MSQTTNLQLPLLAAAQAQKHVTHNEAVLMLDALVQMSVIDRHRTEPPGAPNDGDRYIPASGATGVWADWDLNVAWFVDGVWTKLVPRSGWRVWVEDEEALLAWDGAAWRGAGLPSVPGGLLAPAVLVPSPVEEIWRADSSRGATPRTATIDSVSGDTITTTASVGYDFGRWRPNIAGFCMIRIWNTDKDPWEPAWIVDSPANDELQVHDAGDISGWAAGDTIRIGDPSSVNALEMFAIDISPYLQTHFGTVFPAKALIMHVGVSGPSAEARWQASTTGASGSALAATSNSDGGLSYTHILVPTTVPSPVSDSNLVFMREQDTMATVLVRLMGVYI